MSELLTHLRSAIVAESRDDDVALLLSGDLDSVSVGLALKKGRQGHPSLHVPPAGVRLKRI
jgi:hypothetical protein